MRRAFGFITFESEEIVDNICSTPKIPFGDKMVENQIIVLWMLSRFRAET